MLTLQQMFAEYAAAQAVRDKQKQQAQQAEERYFTREKPAYDQIERQFFQSMAGNLARRLEPQKPCPVCGALEHPHPAACTEDTVTEEQFQKRGNPSSVRCKTWRPRNTKRHAGRNIAGCWNLSGKSSWNSAAWQRRRMQKKSVSCWNSCKCRFGKISRNWLRWKIG
ncbi:MAG: hypothetical protein ACLT29_04430 [Ruminococcus callidus]